MTTLTGALPGTYPFASTRTLQAFGGVATTLTAGGVAAQARTHGRNAANHVVAASPGRGVRRPLPRRPLRPSVVDRSMRFVSATDRLSMLPDLAEEHELLGGAPADDVVI